MTREPVGSNTPSTFVAFAGVRRIASGALADVALAVKRLPPQTRPVLVFDEATGRVVDLDLRGDAAEMLARLGGPAPEEPKRGRPKLGVAAREVTLLPRHWDWLARQSGGASATLRRLVDAARKDGAETEQARARRDAAYRFMAAMGGDLPGFEEASRALFAADRDRLRTCLNGWPPDIGGQVMTMLDGEL